MTQEYGNRSQADATVAPKPARPAAPGTIGYEAPRANDGADSAHAPARSREHDPALDTTATIGRARAVLPPFEKRDASAPRPFALQRDRYESLRPLGEGAMGSVTLARDNDIARLVAVKRVKTEVTAFAPLARFVEEIRTVGQLEHPNIPSIHDVGADEDGYYFVMRYLEGETLEDVIEKLADGDEAYLARYTYEYRIQLFLKVLDAVEFAHAQGILHRDIKPSNIIVGKFGQVTLADWGIAKPIDGVEPAAEREDATAQTESSATPTATATSSSTKRVRLAETSATGCVGTPAYMSPEQTNGETLDVRSDIYSLCATFYELLTRRHYLSPVCPIDAPPRVMFEAVAGVSPVVPDTIVDPVHGAVPRELSFFVLRGLSKDRTGRFASVREMIDELQADLQGRTCVYCTSTMVKRGVNEYARFLDAHRVLGVIVMCVVSLFALFGVVQTVRLVTHSHVTAPAR